MISGAGIPSDEPKASVDAPQSPTRSLLSAAQLGFLVEPARSSIRGVVSAPVGLVGDNARVVSDVAADLVGTGGAAFLVGTGGAAFLVGTGGAAFLVGNNSAGLVGNNSAGLVGNNSAGLVGNNSAGLVGNNSAGLVGNNSAGLVGTGGAAFFELEAEIPIAKRPSHALSLVATHSIADGFAYLSSADDRFFVRENLNLYAVLTDERGQFSLATPATDSLVINVLLKGNRRLTATTSTLQATRSVTVNLATTMVTEFLRAMAIRHHFALGTVLSSPAALSKLDQVVALTEQLLADDSVAAHISPEDLTIARLPILRQRYAAAFATWKIRSLSDTWVDLLREATGDTLSSEAKFRILGYTSVEAAIPRGRQGFGVAVGPSETLFLSDNDGFSYEVRAVPVNGPADVLISDFRSRATGPNVYLSLVTAPDGRLLGTGARPVLDLIGTVPGASIALRLLDLQPTGGSLRDATFDDEPDPGVYLADERKSVVYHIPRILSRANPPVAVFAGKAGVSGVPGVLGAHRDNLRLNTPGSVLFHRRKRDGRALVFVSDEGLNRVLEVDVVSGLVRPVAGSGAIVRPCYSPSDEGRLPLQVNLAVPGKLLIDQQERLIILDSGHGLVRLVSVFDPAPSIWTIAGIPKGPGACEKVVVVPPFARVDGDARRCDLGLPVQMARDGNGHLILTDTQSNLVHKLWLGFLK